MEIALRPWRFLWKYSLSHVVDLQITLWEKVFDNWEYIAGTLFASIIPIAKVIYVFTAFNANYSSFPILMSLVWTDALLLVVEMLINFMVMSDVMDDKLYYGVAVSVWIILFIVEAVVFPMYARHVLLNIL